MAPLPVEVFLRGIPASFQWPVKFCASTTFVLYILSLLTGNASQVDRVWTFLPTIYTAYFALLPLWPSHAVMPLWPYTPETVHPAVATTYSPRALLMFGLVVRAALIYLQLSTNLSAVSLDVSVSTCPPLKPLHKVADGVW